MNVYDQMNADAEYYSPKLKLAVPRKDHPELYFAAYINDKQIAYVEQLYKIGVVVRREHPEGGTMTATLAPEYVWKDATAEESKCWTKKDDFKDIGTPYCDQCHLPLNGKCGCYGKQACVCGEKDCPAEASNKKMLLQPMEVPPVPKIFEVEYKRMTYGELFQQLSKLGEEFNKHTNATGPGPLEPPVVKSNAMMVETTVPRTGKLQEVEESFAMNLYQFWTSACKTDNLWEEDPPRWAELEKPIRENFVQALRTQVLMPIQTYINAMSKDRDLATSMLSKYSQAKSQPTSDKKSPFSQVCYACARAVVDSAGDICSGCQRSMKP